MRPAGNNSLSDIFGPPAPPAPPAPPQAPHLLPIPEDTVLTAPEISAAPDQPMAASPGGQPLGTPPGLDPPGDVSLHDCLEHLLRIVSLHLRCQLMWFQQGQVFLQIQLHNFTLSILLLKFKTIIAPERVCLRRRHLLQIHPLRIKLHQVLLLSSLRNPR